MTLTRTEKTLKDSQKKFRKQSVDSRRIQKMHTIEMLFIVKQLTIGTLTMKIRERNYQSLYQSERINCLRFQKECNNEFQDHSNKKKSKDTRWREHVPG